MQSDVPVFYHNAADQIYLFIHGTNPLYKNDNKKIH
jgi:hypothetical protein